MVRSYYFHSILVLLLVWGLLTGCGSTSAITPVSTQETIPPTSTTAPFPLPAVETHITIDGQADDWAGREALTADPAGDAEAGFLDLSEGYAFVNQNALYLLVQTVDPQASLVQFDLEFQTDDRRLLISWSPGQSNGFIGDVTADYQPVGPTENSSFALGSALEGRVDLRDLGNPQDVSLAQIRVMVGECCDYPAWRSADEWNPAKTPLVSESDPPRLVSDELRYTLARRFQLPDGYVAEQLFTPPAPDLTGIGRSADGTLFLQQGGLSAGISIVDPTTAEVTRILDLPPAGAGYSSIVGGPGDSAFIRVGDEIWQVKPDGSYDVWGESFNGQIECYTSDGRLLGQSGDGSRVIEIFPGGSNSELASGFSRIYDVLAAEDGTLFVSDDETGNVTRVDVDGSQYVLAAKVLYRDPMDMWLDAQGNLYLNSVVSGFVKIDRNSGKFTRYDSAHSACTIHQADFVMDENSRVYFIDPTCSTVTWADLATGESGMLVSNQGANTWAADIGPDEALYVGSWGCEEDAAQVIRLGDDGSREVFVDGLQGAIDDIAFSADGGMYIASHVLDQGSPVFYVAPGSQTPVKISGVEGLSSLAFDPLSGNMFAARGGSAHGKTERILELSADGLITEHAVSLPKAPFDFIMDTGADGSVYAYASEAERQQTGPVVERWTLKLDLENGSSEILFQYDRQGCCVMGNLTVDTQGNVWWLVDPEFFLYKITPDGKATLFAQNLPIDPAAVVVDSQGDVYFTSPSGIFRIYKEE